MHHISRCILLSRRFFCFAEHYRSTVCWFPRNHVRHSYNIQADIIQLDDLNNIKYASLSLLFCQLLLFKCNFVEVYLTFEVSEKLADLYALTYGLIKWVEYIYGDAFRNLVDVCLAVTFTVAWWILCLAFRKRTRRFVPAWKLASLQKKNKKFKKYIVYGRRERRRRSRLKIEICR